MPSLAQIQQTLNNRDRILVFLEGINRIGVVVVSKNQAFVVGFGMRSAFLKLDADQRFEYLEGRLGPVWEQSGKLWFYASDLFVGETFIQNLRNRNCLVDGSSHGFENNLLRARVLRFLLQ